MRTFMPHEAIVATHPPDGSNRLERGLVAQARERVPDVPVTRVDAGDDAARVVVREPQERRAPARERHAARDLALPAIVGFLAIAGSLLSFLLSVVDAPAWALWPWVLVFDLGFKVAAMATLWVLFQRRPRADRLDL